MDNNSVFIFMTRLFFIILLLSAAPAFAQDYLALSVGQYDVFDRHDELDDNQALDFHVEYRPDHSFYDDNLKPWIGLQATDDGSGWMGGGLLYDWEFYEDFYLTPMVGIGFYTKGASDLDLDNPLQFKEKLELTHELDNKHRFGVGISHLSNAGMGDSNPGVESIHLQWHVPVN